MAAREHLEGGGEDAGGGGVAAGRYRLSVDWAVGPERTRLLEILHGPTSNYLPLPLLLSTLRCPANYKNILENSALPFI